MASLPDLGVPRQIAYVVDDPAAAAADWADRFGAGPFFLSEHIPIQRASYRGADAAFDHTSAYGQWGSLMVELVCQHGDEPSAIRDMFGPGEGGLHHVAFLVDDYDHAAGALRSEGIAAATECWITDEFVFGLFDTRAWTGHMVELYERRYVGAFYAMVADAAQDWDGADPVRPLEPVTARRPASVRRQR